MREREEERREVEQKSSEHSRRGREAKQNKGTGAAIKGSREGGD